MQNKEWKKIKWVKLDSREKGWEAKKSGAD